ncbi:hypothetical protein HK100_002332 [Physocladia obscura]|uniref:Uncharacterized protein n=1 Tax=Physocladia obscura TaxID=109957 RepID=A0AAD5T7Z5_9FUNG|nr:hypothetical protein HK100_002332 [Physocladia obscura]
MFAPPLLPQVSARHTYDFIDYDSDSDFESSEGADTTQNLFTTAPTATIATWTQPPNHSSASPPSFPTDVDFIEWSDGEEDPVTSKQQSVQPLPQQITPLHTPPLVILKHDNVPYSFIFQPSDSNTDYSNMFLGENSLIVYDDTVLEKTLLTFISQLKWAFQVQNDVVFEFPQLSISLNETYF